MEEATNVSEIQSLLFTKKREMEILVGGTIDLDLLFQLPQRYMDLSGRIKRNQRIEAQQWRGLKEM
jgi:hypothetical protein